MTQKFSDSDWLLEVPWALQLFYVQATNKQRGRVNFKQRKCSDIRLNNETVWSLIGDENEKI